MNENNTTTPPKLRPIHHLSVLEAFDEVADRFDDSFENSITRNLRARLYGDVSRFATPGTRILDINCGTGIDALELARRGYKVTGCDLSPKMILQAQEKGAMERFIDVKFHVVSFEELRKVFSEPFDLVVSNFGGLNCVPELNQVVRQIASLLKPGGVFLAVVMPRISPWDVFSSFSRGRFQSAFFRLGTNVQATGFSGKSFTVHYHSLSTLRRSCNEYFSLIHAHGLSIISPPPHATTFLQRFPRLSSALESIEHLFASWPLVRAIGDHYVAVFRRREVPLVIDPS